MQFPSSQSQSPNTGAIAAPRSPWPTDAECSTSPRKAPVRLTSRSPSPYPALDAELKMNDFYTIDSSFKSLLTALAPDTKKTVLFKPDPRLNQLKDTIQVGTREAERCFKLRNYAECHTYLIAAKSNQVLMLGIIDSTPDDDMSDERRSAVRASCESLGSALTKMMCKAQKKSDAVAQEAARRRKENDSDEDSTPPSSPSKSASSGREQPASPTRSSQKRAQGEADSPVLAQSPSKRQKADTVPPATVRGNASEIKSPASTASTSTSATTTTTTIPQFVPLFSAVPNLIIASEATGDAVGGSPRVADTPSNSSPTGNARSRKKGALSPQAKPRPRSQLFAAPPDFGTRSPRSSTPAMPTTPPPPVPLPDAIPGNVVGQPQSDSDGFSHTS